MSSAWSKKKTACFFFIVFLFRAVFTWQVPLIDDEAYHWSWTQNLMLSYYDHPGMVAWLESLSLMIFGPTYWGVRFPSLVCYALAVWMVYKLAKDLFDAEVATATAFIMLWSPLWGFGGYVASPEPPFMLLTISSCWVFWQGVRPDSKKWSLLKTWLWLGLLMGLGLNSKFIIALLAPGFLLYLLLTPEHRKDLLRPWPWVGLIIATVICVPIFLWNIQFDWPGFRYQFYERHNTTSGISFSRWLQWFAAQIIFYTPVVYGLILFTFFYALKHLRNPQWRYLFCLAAPSLLLFYPQPLWAEFKPHWAGAAHLLLAIGAVAIWKQGLRWRSRIWMKPYSKKITIGVLAFYIPLNLFMYTPFLGPWMPQAYRMLNPKGEWNPRYDLSNEFYGWEELGKELQRMARESHAETGERPFLAALRYETTAQTWWGAKQKIYSLSTTKSHYTVVQKNRSELDALIGQNGLVVTTEKYPANPMEWARFDECLPHEFKTYRGSLTGTQELSRIFTIWNCHRFLGLK